MGKEFKRIFVAALACVALASCGTVVGGAAGAVAGHEIARHNGDDPEKGAVVGGVAGAVVGTAVSH